MTSLTTEAGGLSVYDSLPRPPAVPGEPRGAGPGGIRGSSPPDASSLGLSPSLSGPCGAAADTGVRGPSAFVRGVRAGEAALAAVGVSGDATCAGLSVPDAPGEAGKGMGTNGGPGRGQTLPALY